MRGKDVLKNNLYREYLLFCKTDFREGSDPPQHSYRYFTQIVTNNHIL